MFVILELATVRKKNFIIKIDKLLLNVLFD